MANAQDYNLNQSKLNGLLRNDNDKKTSSSAPVPIQLMAALQNNNFVKVQNKILDEITLLRKITQQNLNTNKKIERLTEKDNLKLDSRQYITSFLGQSFKRGNSLRQDAKDFVKGMGDPFVDTFKYIFGMNTSRQTSKTLSLAGGVDPSNEILRKKNNEELSDLIAEKLRGLLSNLQNNNGMDFSIPAIGGPGGVKGGGKGTSNIPKAEVPKETPKITPEEGKLPKSTELKNKTPDVNLEEGKSPRISASQSKPVNVTTEPVITSQEKLPPRVPLSPEKNLNRLALDKPQGTVEILDAEKKIFGEARGKSNMFQQKYGTMSMEYDPIRKVYVSENAPGSFARKIYPGLSSAGKAGGALAGAAGSGLMRILSSPALLAAQIGLTPSELADAENPQFKEKFAEKYGYSMEDALIAKTDLLFSKLPTDIQAKLKTERKNYNPRLGGTKTEKLKPEEVLQNKFEIIQEYAKNINDPKAKEQFIKSVSDEDIGKFIQNKNKEHSSMMSAIQNIVPGSDAASLITNEIKPEALPATLSQLIDNQMKENENLKQAVSPNGFMSMGGVNSVTQNNFDSSKTNIMATKATVDNPDSTIKRFLSVYSVLA